MDAFEALFNAIPDGLVVVDEAGAIVMANRRAHALFDYECPQLVGMSVDALVPDEARARHALHRRGYARQPRERGMGEANMELVGQSRNGRRFPVEIALSPIAEGAGHRIVASIRDVSSTTMGRRLERKAAQDTALLDIGRRILTTGSLEVALEDITMELAEAVEMGPIWLLQPDPGDKRFTRSVGATSPPPGWLAAEGERLRAALSSGKPASSAQGRIGDAQLPQGMRSASAFPLVATDGSIAAVLIALSRTVDAFDKDLLKLLEATASLLSAFLQREANRQTLAHTQRLRAIGQLTGGVAHDFNNLLTVVGGSLQLLEAEFPLDKEAASLVTSALRAVDQGAALTRKLLSFAGRQQLRPAVTRLGHAMDGLDRLMRATIGERIELDVEIPEDLPDVFVDPGLLDSVVLNLILNARDAIDGVGRISIRLREERQVDSSSRLAPDASHYVALVVQDTGCGMDDHVLAHAFDPFFTTKSASQGTGLGLSMAYGFATQSGGHVHLASQPGEGTAVTLYLPIATELQRRNADTPPVRLPGGDETILLVEDNEAVRATVRSMLHSLGYQVIASATSNDAMECIARIKDIALLMSDVMLGGAVSGYDLARSARAARPDIAVLLTSGCSHVPEGPDRTGFALLPKPYHREELAEALRRAIDDRPVAA